MPLQRKSDTLRLHLGAFLGRKLHQMQIFISNEVFKDIQLAIIIFAATVVIYSFGYLSVPLTLR